MLDAASIQITLQVFITAVGAVNGLFAFLIYRKVKANDKGAMVTFQLHPKKTVHDFEITLAAGITVLIGFITNIYGAMIADMRLLALARIFLLAATVLFASAVYRWWRRMQ